MTKGARWRNLLFAIVFLPVALMCGTAAGASPAMAEITPRILSDTDAVLYARIFQVQRDGDWKAAGALIEQLDDPILLGHVMAQRFLHPTAYRSKYKELKGWLTLNGDHPDAPRLYRLALKRRPANWKYPPKPTYRAKPIVRANRPLSVASPSPSPSLRLSRTENRQARSLARAVTRALDKGHTLVAKQHLRSTTAKKRLNAVEYDTLAVRLAMAYFFDGHDGWARAWADRAAGRSGERVPHAYWISGLVRWRAGEWDAATEFFQKASDAAGNVSWLRSASAFWAARGAMLTGRPERFLPLLERAAEEAGTFYGLLAHHILGRPLPFDWQAPAMPGGWASNLLRHAAGRRALALVQIGRIDRAEKEIRGLIDAGNPENLQATLAAAALGGMARLAFDINRRAVLPDARLDIAAYPIPRWRPDDGFRIEPALIYALIRQESHFKPGAKSRRGARGLLQLMPATASFISGDRRLKSSRRHTLFDPATNLDLGQRYIEHLLDEPAISGDLVRLTAAWNGGPGNLKKWLRRPGADDPLLFMESIPLRETRTFVKRVLANYWIYRDRLGETSPSLDALASGRTPVYGDWRPDDEQLAEAPESADAP